MKRRWFRLLAAFIAATVLMAVAGTIAQTQFVIAALIGVGAPVALSDRLAMTAADLAGFAPLYGALIAVGFAVAFAAAGILLRRLRRLRLPRMSVFALAGAACIGLMLVLMREVFFGIPLIAGARTTAGVLVQVGCGAAAGTIFAILTKRR